MDVPITHTTHLNMTAAKVHPLMAAPHPPSDEQQYNVTSYLSGMTQYQAGGFNIGADLLWDDTFKEKHECLRGGQLVFQLPETQMDLNFIITLSVLVRKPDTVFMISDCKSRTIGGFRALAIY